MKTFKSYWLNTILRAGSLFNGTIVCWYHFLTYTKIENSLGFADKIYDMFTVINQRGTQLLEHFRTLFGESCTWRQTCCKVELTSLDIYLVCLQCIRTFACGTRMRVWSPSAKRSAINVMTLTTLYQNTTNCREIRKKK